MDIEKLIEQVKSDTVGLYIRNGLPELAISTLQAENEKLRAELDDLRIQLDMYGGDVGITAVYKELEQVKRERNAAQALLAERIGVRGAEPITTAFGLPLDRLRELAQADREGRCVVLEKRCNDG